MLVDLIDKLIDRCIQLIQWEKQSRKNMFDDFVTPIYSEFEAVHKDYLESFRRYRTLIKTPSISLDSICDTIREDNIFTEDQRARLKELSNTRSNTTILGPFINSISQYLTSPYDPMSNLMGKHSGNRDLYYQPGSQVYRNELFSSIQAENTMDRKEALNILDNVVLKLQERYSIVFGEYAKLKSALLT